MLKIYVADPDYYDEEAVKILRGVGVVHAKRMSPRQLEANIAKFDIIVLRVDTKLDRKLLKRATNLKIIGSATTGLDHIDTEYANKNGIKVISLHGTHTIPTAQHTIALMLSLARRIPWAFESLKGGKWERSKFIGTQLDGKTLGIVGVGRIGSQVSLYAKGLGMRAIGYDPYVKKKDIKLVKSLEVLLKESDIVTLHTDLRKETINMISRSQLRKMKKSAMLINTSRGTVVNTTDLLDALSEGIISGAALDVFPEEPLAGKKNRFVDYADKNHNLLITPHLGASTHEAVHNAGVEIAKNVKKASIGLQKPLLAIS